MNIEYDDQVLAEVADLKNEAVSKTGFNDFGDPFYEEPLAAWLHDLITGNLNDFGRQFLRRLVLRDLCRRLKVTAYLAEHPEISEVKIPPILIIMAAPRTGTTLLHNLMAKHPLAQTFLRWELMEPVPSPTPETYTTDPRIAKLQASIEPLRGSLLEQMHWVNADEPEEITWGFFDCTGLLGRSNAALTPTWTRWLQEYDHRATFREFRKLIKLLLWKRPIPRGGFLLLKDVLTTARIQMFAGEFPEAKFILVHRDPFRILVSVCTLSEGINQPFIREPPGLFYEDGLRDRSVLKGLNIMFRALVDFQKAESKKVANVHYRDLMNDAVTATRSTYDYFSIDIPENLEESIVDFLEQQRSGKRAKPPEKFDDYGYDAEAVWADPTVNEYCEFFKVKQEQKRLIDTRTGL